VEREKNIIARRPTASEQPNNLKSNENKKNRRVVSPVGNERVKVVVVDCQNTGDVIPFIIKGRKIQARPFKKKQ
jgi:hypothetical protein